MKIILFVLLFAGNQPDASVAAMPSMAECEKARAVLLADIAKEPKITEFVVACLETTAAQGRA